MRPSAGSRLLRRLPAVRLRREAWGGFAFDRRRGDLLELDAEGFAAFVALGTPQTPQQLAAVLYGQGHRVRPTELAGLLQVLEVRGFLQRAPDDAIPLPFDPWADEPVPAASHPLRAPLVAHWAVTYRCNLHCPFCYSESSPQREAGPDAAVRLRLVERLAAWGILEAALGGGEPTVLPDFAELLAAIRWAGMVPNVTTNGTVASERVLRALADHAGVVHLSADWPDLLDAARGAGTYKRLRDTAGRLRKAGVRLGVNLLLTPDNVRDIRRSLDAALDLDVQGITFLRPKGAWAAAHWPGFPDEADLDMLAAGLRSFLATWPPLRLYVDTALREEWARLGLLEDPEPEVVGCGGGQRHVAVTPEGDVYPCSHARRPEYRMGNLLTDNPDQLWCAKARQRYVGACAETRCACRNLPV